MSVLTVWRQSVAKWWQLKMMMIENEHFNCMNTVSCKSDDTWNKLSNPINCLFWHHSCIWLEELPQDMVSHPYLIFRNKWHIKHFLFFLTFSYHWEILYEPHCQQFWVKFAHAGHAILQLILYKLWSKMSLQAFQPYIISNSDITVVSGAKSYPKIWHCSPTLSFHISQIFNIFYFY